MKMPLKQVNEKIIRYPIPIAGCYSHFNWLLEKRARLLTLINETKMKENKEALDDADGYQCHYR